MGAFRSLAQLLPPVLVQGVSRVLHRTSFAGDYASFDEARADSIGYEAPEIAQAFSSADVSVSTTIAPPIQQTLAALAVAIVGRPNLSVLDVGGANGFYYYALRPYLPLSWTILETPAMVRACSGRDIRYIEVLDQTHYDVVLMSGVLQYMPEPYRELTRLTTRSDFLLINRLPLIERERLTVQTVRYTPYPASYPAWFFGRERFMTALAACGELLMQWEIPQEAPFLDGRTVPYRGILVKT